MTERHALGCVRCGTISHLTGGRRTTYDGDDAAALAGQYLELAVDGDALWAASSMGLARFADGTWQSVEGPGGADVRSLAVDADGTLWAIVYGDEPRIARLANGAWTTFQVDGLGRGSLETISTTDAGVFLGTTDGLYRFADGRATPVWPDQAIGPSAWTREVIAVDADEAWPVENSGLWHYVDGGWQGPEMPGSPEATNVHSMAVGQDGRVWAVTDQGVVVREDGRWTTAWTEDAHSVSVAPGGTVWVVAGGGRRKLVQLRVDGGTWLSRTVTCPAGGSSVSVTTDGTVWTSGISWGGTNGLARYDGRTCEAVDPLGADGKPEIVGLAADPTGGLAVAAGRLQEDGGTSYVSVVSVMRLDGMAWSVLKTGQPGHWPAPGLTFGPSGELWLAGFPDGRGLQRYRDGAWQDVVPGLGVSQVSIAQDGTVWLVGNSGVLRIKPDALPD